MLRTRGLSPGALWLAAAAGCSTVAPAPGFWRTTGTEGPTEPAAVPIGRTFHLVRVPDGPAERAHQHLKTSAVKVGPVLAHHHAWDFFVPIWLADGRDMPGGVVITGTRLPHTVSCPMPGEPATTTTHWVVAPDGSGTLTDPRSLSKALAHTSIRELLQHPHAGAGQREEGAPEPTGGY
ncbi:hypothetical protein AR457_40295 [Streptomyces agglomeratus]|uniref:hypothetical protein n=1 Tax=Streptomyces agglomeratus TaxID=285458 RepID=UPI00085278E7|nr:hypothetical protein [Streptomyces agglomeratus]OEJ22126.1 hypothetical protein AR457_40295 [Streptomyces agglomeratus]OEJ36964.1 hypothetical protein BGK70_00950 [Streptomyces agglomeratus]